MELCLMEPEVTVNVNETKELIKELEMIIALGYSNNRNFLKFYRNELGEKFMYKDMDEFKDPIDNFFNGFVIYHNKFTNEVKVVDHRINPFIKPKDKRSYVPIRGDEIFDSYGCGAHL